MDQGWRRFHLLLVFLTLWKHAIGYPSWNSQVNPRSLRYHKVFSPRGSKSFSDTLVTGNIPVDVNSNMLAVKSPSRSQFGSAPGNYESVSQTQTSPSGSVSFALPQHLSAGLSTSLQLQGSSSSIVQGMASQSAGGPGSYSQYDVTYKDRTGLQAGGSGQLVPAQGGSGHIISLDLIGQSSNKSLSSGISQSSSDLQLGGISSQLPPQGSGASQFLGAYSQHAPDSPAHAQPLSPSGRFTSPVTSRQGSQSQFTSTSQDSSSLFVSAKGGSASLYGMSSQSPSTSSQYSPVSSAYPSLGSLSMPVSGPSSVKTSPFSFSSGSRGGSSQLATSRLAQGASSRPVGLYVQSQGSPSQLAFGSPKHPSASSAAAHTASNLYNQGGAQSLSLSQIPLRWLPSASSFSQDSQTSAAISKSAFTAASVPSPSKFFSSVGRPSQSVAASLYSSASMASPQAVSWQYSKTTDGSLTLSNHTPPRLQPSVPSSSQGSPSSGAVLSRSRFSVPSASDPRKSLASGRRLGQSAPASLYSSASMPSPQSGSSLHGQAAGSVLSLSQSPAPQRWQPSASRSSQGSQTSSTAVSQSSSPSQGAKFFLASGSGPSQLVSTQGESSYSGLIQSPSSSAAYAPAYSKPASSPLGLPSQLTSSKSLYASSSQSMAGGTLGASSRYASAQREVGSNIASLQPQVAAGQYAPPSLDVKVPVYSPATSSGSSMFSSLQSQTWQPTTSRRVYNRIPTSGAALTQTSFSPQSVQSSSRFSSVAGGTSRLLAQRRGSYNGLSQSLGSDGRYTPGSPAYVKFGASSLGVSSQSASGPSSSSQNSPLFTTGASGQLASSSGHLYALGESGSSVGSSLLSQDALANVALAPMDTSVSVASQAAAVSSGIQTSGAAAFQSGSSQASSSLSTLQALSSPVDSVTQSASANSQVSPFGNLDGSMTQSSGSSVQAASEGVSSASPQAQTLSESAGSGARVESQGMSGGSTSVLSGSNDPSFGQSAPFSNPSQGSVSGFYGVKG